MSIHTQIFVTLEKAKITALRQAKIPNIAAVMRQKLELSQKCPCEILEKS